MSAFAWRSLVLGLACVGNLLLAKNLTWATEPPSNLNQFPQDNALLAQVTSVSQLSDVEPTDWAFGALQSLVERYGCIEGYPDRTYRGQRALTRYEFAAGLNACLDQVNQLIAASTANLPSRDDIATIRRLQEEFAAELATLRGRVEVLETRAAQIEANQFSTTTKLNGEIITYLADAFGEDASDINNTTIGYRTRIDFVTSFNGKDRLRTRLQATNLRLFDTGAEYGASAVNRALGDVSNETRFTPSSVSQNGEFKLNQLEYRFPVGERLRIFLEASTIDPTYITDPINPFVDTANGAISNFAQVNPAFFPIGNRAGLGANLAITKALNLDFAYLGEDSTVGGPNNPGDDSGFFNGGYSAFAQLVYNSGALKFGLLYVNSYSPRNGVDTLAGSNAAKVIGAGPVVGNSYGFQTNYRFSSRFELGGWVGYTAARALEIKGDADILNYGITLSFPDLGKKGNLGGIVVGMQPKLIGTSNNALAEAIGLPEGQRSDRDTGLHIEAFYKYQVNDNISITPGFFWLTAPNHDDRNSDVVIGTIRTSFSF
jgi:Carbohydrate-selective porin, OprB family/S-layer homology domain